jgi:hypothetical protein
MTTSPPGSRRSRHPRPRRPSRSALGPSPARRAPREACARETKKRVSVRRGIVRSEKRARGRVGARRAFRRGRDRETPRLEKTKMFRPGVLRRSEKIATRARVASGGRGRTSRALFSTRDGTRASGRVARRSTATGRGSHRYARLLPSPRRNRTSFGSDTLLTSAVVTHPPGTSPLRRRSPRA